jgi:DNA replication protein DnaC
MDQDIIVRSSALNNIPKSKLYLKIASFIGACDKCSSKDTKGGKALDIGLCDKCRLLSTSYQRYHEANIPVEYWDLKMEKDFKGDSALLEKYKEYTTDLKTPYSNGTSICFAGSYGLGKSMTITCILKRASLKGYSCLYSTLSDIVSVLTSSDSNEKFIARKELVMVDFLAIDEWDGRYFATDNASDLYARTLESIFRTRSQNKLPTLMATNSPNIVESFHGSLKQSISSLMSGYITIFPVLGTDFRKRTV